MDYVYNETGKPLKLDRDELESYLMKEIVGDFKIVYNKFQPWKTGNRNSNADFLFTIIHGNSKITNSKINEGINNKLFKEWAK